MSNRNALVFASALALIVVAVALFLGWQKDGRINPGLLLFVPIVLIALAAALRRKA